MTEIKSKPKRIVIIEDDGIIVTRLKNILKKFGYNCVDAIAFGEEALKKITRIVPDMILIDIRLSGKVNGIEVAEQINLQFDIPVIFLTAYSEEKLLEQARLTEPYAYLIKPINERELYATIELAFYRHEMETKLKKSEEEVRKTRDYLENLINNANAPIIVWDPEHVITRYNHAFENLSGYKADEVIGKSLEILFPDSETKDSLAKIELTSTGEHWESVEIPILRKDGGVRIVLWNPGTIYEADANAVLSTIAQGQDITDRLQAENMIKAERDKLQLLMEGLSQAKIGIDIIGLDYKIISYNRVLKDRFGDLMGKICYKEFMGLDKPCSFCPMIKAIKNNNVERIELKANDGRDYEITSAPLPGKDGIVDKAIEVINDITERKQAEEELKKKMNELEIFNVAAVDRELMVNDLRKEINELLRKLGKEPKYNIVERKPGFHDESG